MKNKITKAIIYTLEIIDMSHLGGTMGTEYTTSEYHHFYDIEDAKKFAQKNYNYPKGRGPIKWKREKGGITSGDLMWVMYKIYKLKIK